MNWDGAKHLIRIHSFAIVFKFGVHLHDQIVAFGSTRVSSCSHQGKVSIVGTFKLLDKAQKPNS